MNEKFPYGYDLNAYIDKGGYSVHVTAGIDRRYEKDDNRIGSYTCYGSIYGV